MAQTAGQGARRNSTVLALYFRLPLWQAIGLYLLSLALFVFINIF